MNPLIAEPTKNRFDSDFYVQGYAARWEPYVLYEDEDGPIYEQFEQTAFLNADMSDIIMLYDHQGKVLARNSNNTLHVELDDVGIFFEADLSKSVASREMFAEIDAGLVTKMSWSFRVGSYDYDKETRTILHRSVKKVFDVSAVGIPANDATEVNSRSFANGVIEQERTERSERERKLKLLTLEIELSKET